MPSRVTRQFLKTKAQALSCRAYRLVELSPRTVGIRSQDRLYAPSAAHFKAANKRLSQIEKAINQRLKFLQHHLQKAPAPHVLLYMALVEREVDRARRAFGMFFEIFSQRGSAFAPALAAHDVIAADCYAAVQQAAPLVLQEPRLKPITYMEHGYSPATMRRGVTLSRLLGEPNPFPIIRIPWDRDNPWQAVFLHEVSHNLQADLGLWHENKRAVGHRLLRILHDPMITSVYRRWHKEIFADLAAVLLGGPASVWGMLAFLSHPAPKTLTYKPGGVHPTGYLRALILAEMLRRMGFEGESAKVRKTWMELYSPGKGHRIPVPLLETSSQIIPHVVDEMAFQPKRNLAQRALADVIPFHRRDEQQIREASAVLARGQFPADLPPRFFVSASRYALQRGASIPELSKRVIAHLSKHAAGRALISGGSELVAVS